MTSPVWDRAALALALLAVDPRLGGLWVRARVGPVRDRLTDAVSALPSPARRIHPEVADDQLFGGVDLGASLAAGYVVRQSGILSAPASLILPMAERASAGLAARLGGALDTGGTVLVALDEGAEPEERLHPALADLLAFHIDLTDLPVGLSAPVITNADALAEARATLPHVRTTDAQKADLTTLAHALGIGSLRAPALALRAARVIAASDGALTVDDAHTQLAAALVLAPRARQFPAEDQAEEAASPPQEPGEGHGRENTTATPQDLLLEAVKSALPDGTLNLLATTQTRRVRGGLRGSGARKAGNRRGRPLPPRPGRPDGRQRIDIIGTLRAAAPWQAYRREFRPLAGRRGVLDIRPDDIRLRRFEEKSDRLLIFTVDASGSSAMARLAEAKGAIESLLGEAYARRDHVALVAFRGTGAEVLLPPTRSLVQTKRRLAALPGGGGTPLAAGLRIASELGRSARAKGLTPSLALLTDGRANIALDGQANRQQAAEDARALALHLRDDNVPSLVIDTGSRPSTPLRGLAHTMDAAYIALPRADATRLSAAVRTGLAR